MHNRNSKEKRVLCMIYDHIGVNFPKWKAFDFAKNNAKKYLTDLKYTILKAGT